mmetsp:Transcript_50402/g.114406  ORF Transcript_50402/g.114406 Transcript_50402/m.114406 type:complete len:275 (+) Transcript_50402:878-1702(+)
MALDFGNCDNPEIFGDGVSYRSREGCSRKFPVRRPYPRWVIGIFRRVPLVVAKSRRAFDLTRRHNPPSARFDTLKLGAIVRGVVHRKGFDGELAAFGDRADHGARVANIGHKDLPAFDTHSNGRGSRVRAVHTGLLGDIFVECQVRRSEGFRNGRVGNHIRPKSRLEMSVKMLGREVGTFVPGGSVAVENREAGHRWRGGGELRHHESVLVCLVPIGRVIPSLRNCGPFNSVAIRNFKNLRGFDFAPGSNLVVAQISDCEVFFGYLRVDGTGFT